MRSKLLFAFVLLFLFLNHSFAQFKKSDLLEYSKRFITQQQLGNSKLLEATDVSILKDNNIVYAYVVNLKPKGFIVFSPSRDLSPVISFSNESNFDYSNSVENTLLDMIKRDMKSNLKVLEKKQTKKNLVKSSRNNDLWGKLEYKNLSKSSNSQKTVTLIQYGSHFTNVWGGVNCHDTLHNSINVGNYYTPNNYSPGCVATTLSMVLRYYEWPESGVGSHTNVDNQGSSQTSWSANFGNATYDYANMLDEYHHAVSNLTQQQAMGYLAFHCATALDMDYESTGSTSNINRIPSAAGSYFRFSGHHQYSSWSSFWSRMHENLQNGHPVPLAIDASSGTGHAPAVDGYRYNDGDSQSDYYYHLNMGWYGTSNAWYRLQNSFNAGGYTSVSAAVFDLLPEPVFTTSSFTATSKTFTLNWKTSSKLNWSAFELQESADGGSTYTTVSNTIADTTYSRTVASGGTYKYRVRSKVDGNYYADSYSRTIDVEVPYDFTYLDFDGNDSFFVYDNTNNDFDVSSVYTIENWIKVDSRTSATYPVVLDRKTVFSLYLIADSNADYAVKFVARNSSGSIIASVQSDTSTENLNFGEWVHVAASRTGGTLKFFVNGILAASSTDSDFALSASSNALNIGARYWSSYERYLDGKIDKIRITDDAKYTSNFTPDLKEKYVSDSHTRILLALDEGTGTALTDGAGNFTTVQLRSSPNQPNWMFDDENIGSSAKKSKKDKIDIIVEKNGVYPNPATSNIMSRINVVSDHDATLLIYDFLGRVRLKRALNLEKGNNIIDTDISKLTSGFYFLVINTAHKKIKSKFLKK